MARGIVRRPGEPCRPRPIGDLPWGGHLGELRELAEPTGHHWAELAVRGHPQERIATAELAVLVATTDDVRLLEAKLAQIERHDVEGVIRIHEQLRADSPACREHRAQVRDDLRGAIEDG